MNCKRAWSRPPCRDRFAKPASASRKLPARQFLCAASRKSFRQPPRTSTPSRTPPTSTDTAAILVATVDGKGIPRIKPDGGRRAVRRTKGQKANRKKMATVAAVFTRAPWIRTPEQVVESLFGRDPSPQNPPPPRPEHQRLWASLT